MPEVLRWKINELKIKLADLILEKVDFNPKGEKKYIKIDNVLHHKQSDFAKIILQIKEMEK